MEKMARVLELAKKAQASGLDNEGVRDVLRQIRKAYEVKKWEEIDALSDRALGILDVITAASP